MGLRMTKTPMDKVTEFDGLKDFVDQSSLM